MSYRKQQAMEVGAQLAAFKEFCEVYWDLVTDFSDSGKGIRELTLHENEGFLLALKQLKLWRGRGTPTLEVTFASWTPAIEAHLESVWINTRYPRLVNQELKQQKLAKKEKTI
jgi:hypothetical protein